MGETLRSTNHKASSQIRKLIYQPIAIFATICRRSEAVWQGVALVFIIRDAHISNLCRISEFLEFVRNMYLITIKVLF